MSDDDARYAALEARLEQSLAWSTKAKEDAHRSISEVQGIADGLKLHLASLEARRAGEAADDKAARDFAEAARKAAAAAHAKRFEEQGRAIQSLLASSKRSKWVLGVVVGLIATLSNQAAELIKPPKPPPQPVPCVSPEIRP